MDPVHLEAEMAIVGACIVSPIDRYTVLQDISDADFWADKTRYAYQAAKALDDDGEVNPVTVHEWLKAHHPEDGITLDFLFSCVNSFTGAVGGYITVVRRASKRRQLVRELRASMEEARDETVDPDEAQSKIEERIYALRKPPKDTLDPVTWAEQVESEAAMVESGLDNRRRVRTGYRYIDDKLKMWPRKMSVMAGHTSGGKTATALCLAVAAAVRIRQRVVIYSLEMDRDELFERVAAAELNIDYGHIQERRLNADERKRIKNYMAEFKKAPLIIRDAREKPWSAAAIRADARYIAHTEGQIDLIVIDYLLLMEDLNTTVEGSDRRDLRVGNIVWNLIRLAKDLDCHVMLLHQFNRENSRRVTSRPKLSDLKESSAIEQHAHNVVLLYRPERDEAYEEEDRAQFAKMLEFIIAKQRAGQVGSVWLTFEGDKQKIVTLHHDQWKKLPTVSINKQRGR